LKTSTIKTSTANEISNIIDSFCNADGIPTSPYQLSNSISTEHFYIEYDDIFGGLSIQDYINTLEIAWNKQINEFGWAAPPVFNANPAPNNLYHVRILDLAPDLYGFVSDTGTHAGFVGDNPNTPWNDVDSYATCMVLNNNFEETGSDPLKAAQATIAHEFNHSIQYGYTDLFNSNSSGIAPNFAFIEGGATWIEDEVFDSSNDNYNFLWLSFSDSLSFPSERYHHWITFRGLTERFGSGIAGGSEQVMQDFWENISKGSSSEIEALDLALQNKGTNLSDAFQAYAIAVKYNKPCIGNYFYPYCIEEGADYVDYAGETNVHHEMEGAGIYSSSLRGGYSIKWIGLPASGNYNVKINNTSQFGELRASIVCDTGAKFVIQEFPNIVRGTEFSSINGFNTNNCISSTVVIVNQDISPSISNFTVEVNSYNAQSVGIEIIQGSDDGGTNPGDCVFYNTDNEVYLGACFEGGDITSGFRFQNVQVPRHANIESAYLNFTVDGTYTDAIQLQIYVESSSNSLTYSESSPPSNRLIPSNFVYWTIRETWELGEQYNTPDISDLIQELVNRPDWNAGQPISIIIKNSLTNPVRRVIAFERASFDPSLKPAQLVITYNPNPIPTPTSQPPNSTPLPTSTPIIIQPTFTPLPVTPQPTDPPPPAEVPWICYICGIGCPSSSAQRLSLNDVNTYGTPTAMPNAVTPTPQTSALRVAEIIELADLLYRVRDELLNTTPEGQRLSDLYYTYIPNIVQVLITHPELSDSSFETMNLFAPSLQALLDGNGDSVVIITEQVQGLQSFLDALIQYGDEDLQSIISSELEKHPLENMVGLTMNEAWSQINGYEIEWLSPMGNANPYTTQQGSTISVKFSLTDFEGNFVEDETVYLQITDMNGNVVLGPIYVSNNPNNGIKIQGNQYHYNLKTKDLPIGSYNLEVFYNNETQSEIKTINLKKK
jgi:hypothetical protein